MKAEVVYITPEMAKKWLKSNNRNRPISKATVLAYASDMKAGNWALNGESISFDEDGNLVNGQHRLAAIIEADTPIYSLVVYNIGDKKYIDNGRVRSFKDSAQLEDFDAREAYMRSNPIAAIARFSKNRGKRIERVTNAQVREYMIRNGDSLRFVYSMIRGGTGTAGIRGLSKAAVWAAVKAAYDAGYPYDMLIEWCNVYKSGEGTKSVHTPILRFRNWCIANASMSGSTFSESAYMRAQYSLKAFEMQKALAVSKEAAHEFYELK